MARAASSMLPPRAAGPWAALCSAWWATGLVVGLAVLLNGCAAAPDNLSQTVPCAPRLYGGCAVPGAVSGLTATAGNAQVTVNWAENANTTAYNVYRCTGNSSCTTANGSRINTTVTIAGAPYLDANASNSFTYYYLVTALNASGEGPAAGPVGAQPSTTRSNPPLNLAATLNAGGTQATVTWVAGTLASGSTLAGYNLYFSTGNGVGTGGTKISVGAGTSYVHAGLTPGATNFYVVTALVNNGTTITESAPSQQASATLLILTAFASRAAVVLNWTPVPGAVGFNVYSGQTPGVGTSSARTYAGTGTSFTIGASNGVTYYFIVTALDSSGTEGAPSNTASATPSGSAPAAPTGLAAATTPGVVALSWNTSGSNATAYKVYRSTTAGTELTPAAPVPLTTSAFGVYSDSTVTNGTRYYYVVTGTAAGIEGPPSAEVSALPQLASISAPTGLTAVGGNGEVALSWTAPAAASTATVTYNLYFANQSGTGKNGTKIAASSGSTYLHSGLTNSNTYYYVVTAVNGTLESSTSVQAQATPLATAGGSWAGGSGDMVVPVYSGSAAAINGVLYTFGGNSVAATGAVQAYDPLTNTWTAKTAMPSVLTNTTAAAVGGTAYLLGGLSGVTAVNTVQAFNPSGNLGTGSWSTVAATGVMTARYDAASAVLNGLIYVIGGYSGVSALTTVEAYDPAANAWIATIAPLPQAVTGAAAETINGKIYVFGGYTGSLFVGTVQVYDPALNTWSSVSALAMPTARAYASSAVLNGQAYVFGGDASVGAVAPLQTVESYDAVNNQWTTRLPLPTAVAQGAGDTINGVAYVVGGNSGATGTTITPAVQAYSPAVSVSSNTWAAKSSSGFTARNSPAVAAANGRVYVFGGTNTACTALATVEAFNPYSGTTGTWSTIAAAGFTAREGAAAIELNGNIYVIGGDTVSGTCATGTTSYLNTVQSYNLATGLWTTRPALRTARTASAVAAVNGLLYVIGGFNNGSLSSVESFDPVANVAWNFVTTSSGSPVNLPEPLDGHGAVAINGKIYAVGGFDSSTYTVANPCCWVNTLSVYTPPGGLSWSSKAAMPLARVFMAVAELNGTLLVAGGNSNAGTPFSTLQAYSVGTDSWSSKASLPTGITFTGGAALNGVFYVMGGSTSSLTGAAAGNLVYAYTQ